MRKFFLIFAIFFIFVSNSFPFSPDEYGPVADPRAIVKEGDVRFTVLTPQLIRMEWSKNRKFEDSASLVFIKRNLPVPEFKVLKEKDWLFIKTEKLLLKYRIGSGKFTKDNLFIEFFLNEKKVVWHPGMEDKGNLKGTIRTLDGVEGETELEPGLLSREGWVLIDDSKTPLFDNSEWHWVVPRPRGDYQDWYFFGYGHDYKKALYDFTLVAGKIPLPPRFAFGVWWSKYWAYTDQEFKQLINEFEIHDVPLDVLVIDMDWHLTFGLRWDKKILDQAGHMLGWTGYTWNRILFPEPKEFLSWCEKKGLKTPLNLHPASGVQPHEEKYPEMARAMGIDPSTKRYVPFDITDKKFAINYLKILHYPLEEEGVDFWWLDWQQQHITKVPGLNPTWWLNYVHFTDMERRGKRPILFHRWGGLGNHRYQIGFSGDTISVWASLAFQPYFTATASNVLYGYWSHDIGGHMPGKVSPELYTRWIQFGVFSPILRTHTTKNPEAERRIWAYPVDYFLVMREAFLLRYALIPYIYTYARKAYDTGISLCRPMYYDYPEKEEAYKFRDQYMFGDRMIVSPITAPEDQNSMLSKRRIWLPEGKWIEWFTGSILEGPGIFERNFSIDEIPVYVRAGSIIPFQPKMRHTGEKPVDPLILTVFPYDSGEIEIYEDEGNTLGYKKGEFSWQKVLNQLICENKIKLEIHPARGKFPGMLERRSYEIRVPMILPPEKILCNGKEVIYSKEEKEMTWRYDGNKLMVIINLPKFNIREKVEVDIELAKDNKDFINIMNGFPGKINRLKKGMLLLNTLWPKEWSPDSLIDAFQTGNRIELNPQNAKKELIKFHEILPIVYEDIKKLEVVNRELVNKVLAHIREGF